MSENFFSEDNVPSADWMKFEKPGDVCKGTFVKRFEKQGSGNLPDQVVFQLTNASKGVATMDSDNNITGADLQSVGNINVGIKASNSYILSRLEKIKDGDIIGFGFTHEIAPRVKGNNPAKSIKPFVSGVDQEYLAQAATEVFDDSNFE